MPQVTLTLGDISFAGMEVPESINGGGSQTLVKQTLIGGTRVIDAMGRDDAPIAWSGIFMGASAVSRAQYLDSMRIAGQAITLTYGSANYTVVISKFNYDYKLSVYIPYSIECEVVSDNVTASTPGVVPSVDDQMDSDQSAMDGLVAGQGDGILSGLTGTLDTAISTVSTFANASQAVIASVLNPLTAVQGRVNTLMESAVNTAQNVSTAGGVLPNNPIAQNVASLAAQVTAFQTQAQMAQLGGVVGRIAQNTVSVATNTKTITVGGGNLMTIAANQYGDPTSWTAIAKANGLSDPQLVGLQNLIIPIQPDKAGGLLGAQS